MLIEEFGDDYRGGLSGRIIGEDYRRGLSERIIVVSKGRLSMLIGEFGGRLSRMIIAVKQGEVID
jgi:hypothetical protein